MLRNAHPAFSGNFLSVRDIANLLGVTATTVYRLARTGEIPSYRFGRSRRFSREDLLAYLEKAKEGSLSEDEVPGLSSSGPRPIDQLALTQGRIIDQLTSQESHLENAR